MKYKLYCIALLFLSLVSISDKFTSIVEAAKNDIGVSEIPSMLSDARKGYGVFQFLLENRTERKQKIDIFLVDNDYDSKIDVKKQIELMERESKEEKIFYPNGFGRGEPRVEFRANGEEIASFRLKRGSSINSGYGSRDKQLLVDDKINKTDISKLFQDSGLDWSAKDKFSTFHFGGGTSEMDKDWFAYSQYDGLMYYALTFMNEMPATVQSAILDYVKAGGHLILLGNEEDIDKINLFDKTRVIKKGIGLSSGLLKRYSVGFGYVSFFDNKLFEKIKPTATKSSSSSSSSYGRWSNRYSSSNKTNTSTYTEVSVSTTTIDSSGKIYKPLDIIKEMDIISTSRFSKNFLTEKLDIARKYKNDDSNTNSSILLSFLVLFFAFLMGPVNFIVLKIYNKKIWFFFTVPIISFICCACVFAVYFFTEYNRLDIRRMSYTILDENNNYSVTFGGESISSGKSLNYELSFPLSSVVNSTEINNSYRYRSSSPNKSIVLDKFQNFTTGWIRPKNPLAYSITSIKHDRARLEITKNSNTPEVLNGLGADIGHVYVVSENGAISYGQNIRAGQRGTTSYIGPSAFKDNKTLNCFDLFNYRNDKDINNALKRYAREVLKPGEYIAYLKTNPYMKQNMDYRANLIELGCYIHGTSKKEDSK